MAEKPHYGGQAVIEGVMMRGRKTIVTAVRRPNGDVIIDTQPLPTFYTSRIRKLPLIRGIIVLVEAIVLGIKTLLYSANVSLEKEEEKISGRLIWLTAAVSLGLSVALFFVAPFFLAGVINPFIQSPLVFHLIEGGIRLTSFIFYIK